MGVCRAICPQGGEKERELYYTRIEDYVRLPVWQAVLKASIHLLTQSCDPISCCGKPVERTNEIGLQITTSVRSTGYPSNGSDHQTESESQSGPLEKKDRQTERQTDRQTDRQTERQERHTEGMFYNG